MKMKARYERPALERVGSFAKITGGGVGNGRDRYGRARCYFKSD